jgi:hypothetical protein
MHPRPFQVTAEESEQNDEEILKASLAFACGVAATQ